MFTGGVNPMLKPIDIHNAEFKRSFKGYNEEEVDAFLAKVVSEYENLFQENQRLQEEVNELKNKLSHMGSREDDVYHLISLTKETVAEAKEVARSQADQVVADAERRARTLLADAEAQQQHYLRRIRQMASQEQEFKERMREVMESVWRQIQATSAAPSSSEDLAEAKTEISDDSWSAETARSTKVFHPDASDHASVEDDEDRTKVFRKVSGRTAVDDEV